MLYANISNNTVVRVSMKKNSFPTGLIPPHDPLNASLSALKTQKQLDFYYLMQTDEIAEALRQALTTRHLQILFVEASTEREIADIAEVLRGGTTTETPPVVLIASPDIVQPHAPALQANRAFAGLLPLPFDTRLIKERIEQLCQTLTAHILDIWLYQAAHRSKKHLLNTTTAILASETDSQLSDVITLYSPYGNITIRKSDIIYCVAQNNYTEVWCNAPSPATTAESNQRTNKNIQKILDGRRIQSWENILSKTAFMRVHRSALVRVKVDARIERNYNRKGLVLTLPNGDEIKVAEDKTRLFLERRLGRVVVSENGAHHRITLLHTSSETDKYATDEEYIRSLRPKNFRIPKQRKKTTPKPGKKRDGG